MCICANWSIFCSLTSFNEALLEIKARGVKSSIDVGFAGTPTLEFRKDTTLLFEKTARPTSVRLHDLPTDTCVNWLLSGKLDVAFVPKPLNLPGKLEFEPLLTYPIRCIVGRSHRLASRSTVGAQELRDERFVIFSRKSFPQYYDYLKHLLGFDPLIRDEYEDDEELLSAVDRSHGVALMLSTVGALHYDFCLLPILPGRARIPIGAIYRNPIVSNVEVLIRCAKLAIGGLKVVKGLTTFGGKICKGIKLP